MEPGKSRKIAKNVRALYGRSLSHTHMCFVVVRYCVYHIVKYSMYSIYVRR
jgi:hypothetical protein